MREWRKPEGNSLNAGKQKGPSLLRRVVVSGFHFTTAFTALWGRGHANLGKMLMCKCMLNGELCPFPPENDVPTEKFQMTKGGDV